MFVYIEFSQTLKKLEDKSEKKNISFVVLSICFPLTLFIYIFIFYVEGKGRNKNLSNFVF